MKILVCGGRDFSNYELVKKVLTPFLGPDLSLVHGGARGADSLAGRWALEHSVLCICYPAYWALHGKAAGPIRNQLMLDQEHPDLVLAFPGGRGTADMVSRARAAGVKIQEVSDDP